VPVVLLAEATGGRVPVDAVSRSFAACVPTDGGVPQIDSLGEAIGDAVSDAPRSAAGRLPPSGQPEDAWKASVLDQLFEKLPIHVYVKDRDARIVRVTDGPVSERIHPFGEQFLGKRDIDGVVPLTEGVGSYIDDLRVIETGEPVVDAEEYFPSSNRWFLASKVPLHDENDEIVGLLGITREITDRKERERDRPELHGRADYLERQQIGAYDPGTDAFATTIEA
jgi:PAS domain-containing protein